jgi:hypothetical protein
MTGIKVLSVAPLMAVAELPISNYDKLGIVAVLLLGIIAIWRDSGKRQDKLESIIDKNTAALTEVRDVMRECRKG